MTLLSNNIYRILVTLHFIARKVDLGLVFEKDFNYIKYFKVFVNIIKIIIKER